MSGYGNNGTRTGFLAVWSTTSEPPTYPTPTGCESCTFPFTFGVGSFDTCIIVEDLDTQRWCTYNVSKPVGGTHIVPPITKYCYILVYPLGVI